MTDHEINIAIAEACGFKKEVGCTGIIRWRNGGELFDKLKDYANDLNAMHEAENVLDYDQAEQYASDLWSIIMEAEKGMENPPPSNFATARQRAEAFLRTIGKWEEAKP